jgi:serine/threonine protein phosphatase 1
MDDAKIFIVGDIHGCLDMLNRLMDSIAWRPEKDRVIFIGDYIDRGENPKGVVDYILALKACSPNVDCLIGNHEALFLDYLNGSHEASYIRNGGWNTLRSYETVKGSEEEPLLPPDHMTFFQSLTPYLELDDYYVVHAGFRPYVPIEQQSLQDMIWIRDPFLLSRFYFGKKVIFGHTPFLEPLVMENKIGIDTGAVMGHKLTCLELPEVRFHSVEH